VVVIGFVNSFGIGKEGASLNYCLDWQLALCPLIGLFVILVSRIWAVQDRGMAFLRPMILFVAGVTGVQLCVQAALDCNKTIGLTRVAHRELVDKRREEASLVKLIASFPGPVVSENMTALMRAGKSIPFEPAIIKQTSSTGVFDETDLVKMTSDKYFDAFVLRTDMNNRSYFTPRMLQAMQESYRPYPFNGSDYSVYVRR
jgi:hypothetical protein